MASPTYLPGDLIVPGALKVGSFTLPTNAVGDTQVTAADPLTVGKMYHQYVQVYKQDHGAVVATKTAGIHIARAAGTLIGLVACVKTVCAGAATIVVDLKKNGTTVLSGTILIDSSTAAYASIAATFSATTYVAGDVFEVLVTATAGGGTLGQGLTVALTTKESPG